MNRLGDKTGKPRPTKSHARISWPLGALLALACVAPPIPARAEIRSCEAIFSTRSAPSESQKTKTNSTTARIGSLLQPFTDSYTEFDLDQFVALRASYAERLRRGAPMVASEVLSPLHKLAYIEAMSQSRGLDLFRFENFISNASMTERMAARRALKKLDFAQPASWTRAQKSLVKIWMMSNYDPSNRGLLDTFRTPWTQAEQELILHRVTLSLVRNNMLEALVDVGFVRSPTSIERMRTRLNGAERVLRLSWRTTLNVVSFYFPLFDVKSPEVMTTARDLPPDLARAYVQSGIGFNGGMADVQSSVEAIYGRSARVQVLLNRSERILGAIILPLALYFLQEELWSLGKFTYQSYLESDEAKEARRWREDTQLDPTQRADLIEKLVERNVRIHIDLITPADAAPSEVEALLATVRASAEMRDIRRELEQFTNSELIAAATE